MNVTMRNRSSSPILTSLLFKREFSDFHWQDSHFFDPIPRICGESRNLTWPRRSQRGSGSGQYNARDFYIFFSFFGKISGIFHYFNESFVIDPLNDFERHFAWLSKTSLLLKIGQSPWKLCMVEYLSFSVVILRFSNLSFFNGFRGSWPSSSCE